MRLGPLAFAPRLVPTIAAVAMFALLVSLGRWQSGRAEEKAQLQALYEARLRDRPVALAGQPAAVDDLLYRHVRASGRFVAEGQIFVDNRVHRGMAGFHVVTPLALAGGGALVLVNRGWVARTAAYPAPPPVPVPAGEVTVEGIATVPPKRVLELSAETVTGNVWQNLSLARYAERVRRPVFPVVVLADPPAPGLVAVTEQPDARIDRHREYSLTWYSLAVTVVALWVGLNLRRSGR